MRYILVNLFKSDWEGVEEISYDEFKEYEFTVDDLDEFVGFQIKIVSSGTNEAYPPRFKDLRVIALAQ